MPNHRPGWTKAWITDLNTCEARHESGLVVVFEEDDAGWFGTVKPGTEAELLKQGAAAAAQMAARLMREAGDVYQKALKARQ